MKAHDEVSRLDRSQSGSRPAAFIAAAIALVLFGAGAAPGAEPCITSDLLAGLFGGEAKSIFVGAPAPELASSLPLPADAVKVGGVSSAHRLTLIASVARDRTAAHDEMKAVLAGAGWKPIGEGRPGGGFAPNARDVPSMFCGPDGSMLHYSTLDRTEGNGSLVSVTRMAKSQAGGACAADGAALRQRQQMLESGPMPRLEPPDGVEITFQSNSSSGRGARTDSVGLETGASPRDLAAHFGQQVADQGWTLDADLAGDAIATQLWSLTETSGQSWRGILLVAELDEDSRDASFSIAPRD